MLIRISLFAVSIVLTSMSANAGCTYIAEVNSRTLFMDISDGGCGELSISFTRRIRKDGQPVLDSIKSFPFDKECVLNLEKNGGPGGLTCHANGRTPLAGATYKRKRVGYEIDDCPESNHVKIPVFQYVCVKGCSDQVPKVLEERNICD